MQLVNDIINDLVDNDKSLNNALLKTKVLASQIGNNELLSWVNFELSGYDSFDSLPNYRKNISNLIMGSYINGNMKYTNQTIITNGLDKKFEKSLKNTHFFQSIASLEKDIENNKSQTLAYALPAEIIGLIENNLINMGNPYFQLINARKVISSTVLTQITASVRNKLLDFMLKIDSEFGNLTEIKDLKNKKEQITTIMSQTIINNNGDGNILNTGDKTNIDANISINKGNKQELANRLKDAGVSDEDTNELIEILESETPQNNTTFSVKTNEWIQKMIGKALDGSWNIAIGAAGGLLAETIKAYLGM